MRQKGNVLKYENVIDFFSKVFALLLKTSLLIGGLLVLAYCMHINSYPKDIQVGDTVFFLFVIGAFGIIYGFGMLFGVVSSLWFVRVVDKLGRMMGFTPRYQLPLEWKNKIWLLVSFLIFLLAFISALIGLIEAENLPVYFHKIGLLAIIFACGFCLWISLGMTPVKSIQSKGVVSNMKRLCQEDKNEKTRKLVSIVVFFMPLLCGTYFITFLDMSMKALGIRNENIVIEVNQKNYLKIKESADKLKIPLAACVSNDKESYYISGVNILWQGIGEMTLIEIADNITNVGNERKFQREIKSKDIAIVKIFPRIKYC